LHRSQCWEHNVCCWVDCHFLVAAELRQWMQLLDTGASHGSKLVLFPSLYHWLFSCSDFSFSYSQVDCYFCFWLHAVLGGSHHRWIVFLFFSSMQLFFAFAHGRWLLFCFTQVTLFLQFCGDQHCTVYCCLWFCLQCVIFPEVADGKLKNTLSKM